MNEDKVYILLSNGGYAVDDGHGNFLFDGQKFETPEDAETACAKEGLNYEVV